MWSKEVHVANTSDLGDGEMKEVSVGETRILLARVDDKFHAVSATCPHYGGPLAEGVLCGTRVMCPWHHAAFNIVNGDLEEPPALDALVSYSVRVAGERILVTVTDDAKDRRTPEMVRHDPLADSRQFVIIGAGAAGYAAAQTLREEGFRGRLLPICKRPAHTRDGQTRPACRLATVRDHRRRRRGIRRGANSARRRFPRQSFADLQKTGAHPRWSDTTRLPTRDSS